MSVRGRLSNALLLALLLPCVHCQSHAASDPQAAPPRAAGRSLAAEGGAPSTPRVVLEPLGGPSVTVRVELAETSEQRQRGLMFRKQLDPEAGMLFLFERSQQNQFWMRNTYLPLDMLFIKSDWTVLGIVENATPLTDDSRGVPGESQYVLEVNAGFSRQHGLAAGTKVRFLRDGSGAGQ